MNSQTCVAVFSNTFWSIYNFRRSLIKGFLDQGIRVVAVSANDKYRKAVEELGCETVVVKNLDAKSTSLLKEAKLIWEVQKIFSRIPCQYIYTFTIKPNVYTALTNFFNNKKLVVTINGLGNVFTGGKAMQALSLQLFRLAFARAHRVVFQNRDDFSFFQKRIRLNEAKALFVPGSGVNTREFAVTERPPQEGKSLVFLMACRLLKEKGVYEYIEAARRVKADYKEAQFWLIGMKAINQSAIAAKDLEIYHEQGIVNLMPPSDDVNNLLGKVDVLVLPSYYNEGVPRILLEGLSKGLPLVTTNSVGCKETVVHNKNGYLIKPKNVDALEETLRNMIQLPTEERLKMGAESRRLAETKFDERGVIATYLDIIKPNATRIAFSGA